MDDVQQGGGAPRAATVPPIRGDSAHHAAGVNHAHFTQVLREFINILFIFYKPTQFSSTVLIVLTS